MSDRKSSRKRDRSRSRSKSPSRRDRGRDRDRDDDRKSSRKEKKRHRSRSRSRSRSPRKHSSSSSSKHQSKSSPERPSGNRKSGGGAGNTLTSTLKEDANLISQRALSSTNTYLMSEEDRKAQRDAEQAVLDEEMRKRRERVKAWQAAKGGGPAADHLGASNDHPSASDENNMSLDNQEENAANDTEKWTLDDDDDDPDAAEADESAAPDDYATMDVSALADLPPLSSSSSISPAFGPDAGGENTDETVFTVLGSAPMHKSARKHASIAVTIGGAPSAPIVVPNKPDATVTPVSITAAKALEVATSIKQPVAVSIAPTATTISNKKNRFAAAKEAVISTTMVDPVDMTMETGNASMDADFDPLDAYMSDLYGTGEVAQQDLDVSFLQPQLSISGNAPVPGIAGRPEERDGENEDDNSDDSDSDVNPYGSNFITLEQIMGSAAAIGESSNSKKRRRKGAIRSISAGWESDSAMSSQQNDTDTENEESAEAREAREEAERVEFINAIRRARELEEEQERLEAERLQSKEQTDRENDEADAKKRLKITKDEDLGRVFGGEGDVMDESEVEAKKKSALELFEEQKRGKELKPVDHSQIQYIPFRKNLYIVPKALAKLDEEEVKLRREALSIKVRGKQCPCPVDSWEQCGLSDKILDVIEKNAFKTPFAIQKQAIPAIMCGRDVIGVAKTGSGKTLAFLLPMLRHIMDQPPLGEGEGPIGLIMAPARELAFQIYNEAKKFCKPLGLRAACVYGGAGIAEQIADLKRGSDIVVCTPGRMIDILTMQAGKLVSFKRVSMVIMDEADRMFDMGFEPQIKMITQNIRPDRQTVLFSATFPKQIEKLAKSILKLPLEIVVGDRSVANKDITQYVEIHDEDEKFLRLLQLLGIWNERGSVLIFVDKQDKCDQLFQDLLKSGYPCLSLHGGKDQVDRDHTLHEFKTLIKTVMVATSVAGRGLDVPEIVCVINYNCPNHLEDYVHRIGRTGRAGRKGTAYTFISPNEEQYSPLMCKALEQAEQPIPAELQAMQERFKDKVSKGEAHWVSNGFQGTKGFTFDSSEMNEAQKLASMQRRQYEIEQGIINPSDAKDDIDPDGFYDDLDEAMGLPLTDAPASETDQPTTVQNTQVLGVSISAPLQSVPDTNSMLRDVAANIPSQGMTPLERARALAAAMNRPQSTAPPIAHSVVPAPPTAADLKLNPQQAIARAKQIAMQMSVAGNPDNPDEQAAHSNMHFSADFEINDYPPQVRRKVTNRLVLDQVCDMTGVAIIARGSYVPPGKKPEPGDVKLYLFIEAPTELQVKQAKLEIQRLLDEETIRQSNSGGGGLTSSSYGRYSVL